MKNRTRSNSKKRKRSR